VGSEVVTGVAPPNAASSRTARYSVTARPAASGGRPSLPVNIGSNQAGIDRKAFTADKAFLHAPPHCRLEHLPQQIAVTKAAMPVL